MIVRAVDWHDAEAVALRTAQQHETADRYGTPDYEPGPPPSADDVSVFYVAFDNDEAVGCAGLRRLGDTEGEIKRMYVRPDRRGSGAATALLDALEGYGRQSGWSRLLLETGHPQPDAVRFYERQGFTRIPNYGHYVGIEDSLCYEKLLFAVDPAGDVACEGCE